MNYKQFTKQQDINFSRMFLFGEEGKDNSNSETKDQEKEPSVGMQVPIDHNWNSDEVEAFTTSRGIDVAGASSYLQDQYGPISDEDNEVLINRLQDKSISRYGRNQSKDMGSYVKLNKDFEDENGGGFVDNNGSKVYKYVNLKDLPWLNSMTKSYAPKSHDQIFDLATKTGRTPYDVYKRGSMLHGIGVAKAEDESPKTAFLRHTQDEGLFPAISESDNPISVYHNMFGSPKDGKYDENALSYIRKNIFNQKDQVSGFSSLIKNGVVSNFSSLFVFNNKSQFEEDKMIPPEGGEQVPLNDNEEPKPGEQVYDEEPMLGERVDVEEPKLGVLVHDSSSNETPDSYIPHSIDTTTSRRTVATQSPDFSARVDRRNAVLENSNVTLAENQNPQEVSNTVKQGPNKKYPIGIGVLQEKYLPKEQQVKDLFPSKIEENAKLFKEGFSYPWNVSPQKSNEATTKSVSEESSSINPYYAHPQDDTQQNEAVDSTPPAHKIQYVPLVENEMPQVEMKFGSDSERERYGRFSSDEYVAIRKGLSSGDEKVRTQARDALVEKRYPGKKLQDLTEEQRKDIEDDVKFSQSRFRHVSFKDDQGFVHEEREIDVIKDNQARERLDAEEAALKEKYKDHPEALKEALEDVKKRRLELEKPYALEAAKKISEKTQLNVMKDMWPQKGETTSAWWGRLDDNQKTGLLVGGGIGLLGLLMMMGKEDKDALDWVLALGIPVAGIGGGAYFGNVSKAKPGEFDARKLVQYMQGQGYSGYQVVKA